jgi:hypothetical protein
MPNTRYSHVRLMPVYKLTKKKRIGCPITYILGSSRSTSPLDAGLDQLHPTSNLGIGEASFERMETPMGVFSLHTLYREQCDYSIEVEEQTGLMDLEPRFFQAPSLKDTSTGSFQAQPGSFANSKPVETFANPNNSISSHILANTPDNRSLPQQVPIPYSTWRDNHRPSLSSASPSPETYFKFGTAPSTRSIHSFHLAFTPPSHDAPPFGNFNHSEAPPFSFLPTDSSKFSLEKSTILATSPPFAMAEATVINLI